MPASLRTAGSRRSARVPQKVADDAPRPMGRTQSKFRNGVRMVRAGRGNHTGPTTIDRISLGALIHAHPVPRDRGCGLRVHQPSRRTPGARLHGRPRAAQRPAVPDIPRSVRAGTTLRDGPECVVRGLLRVRRARLLSRSRLANARADPRPVHRIPRPHQWAGARRRRV